MDVKFIKVATNNLSSVPVVDGQVIVCTDSSHIYYDMGGARRSSIIISDNYTTSAGAASSGVVASSKAVSDAYNHIKNILTDAFKLCTTSISGQSITASGYKSFRFTPSAPDGYKIGWFCGYATNSLSVNVYNAYLDYSTNEVVLGLKNTTTSALSNLTLHVYCICEKTELHDTNSWA